MRLGRAREINDWISIKSRFPREEDGNEYGHVFVWHIYQGVMLTAWNEMGNPFFAYWMPARITADEWIEASERKPTREDADALNCVLARDDLEGIELVTGWHQFTAISTLSRWIRLPPPPPGYKELRI